MLSKQTNYVTENVIVLNTFEDFVGQANSAQDTQSLVKVLLEAAGNHGLDRMIFCLFSDHSQIGLEAGVGYLRNYPDDWMKYYFSKGFDKVDPVISYCYQKESAFSWEEMQTRLTLTSKQETCLNLGREAGLNNGICVPVWGAQKFAGVGFASSEKRDSWDGNIDILNAMCNHFYLTFLRLHKHIKTDNLSLDNVVLTPREREILLWMSKGKTTPVISEILNISAKTTDYHIQNIYRKLHVNERVLAVTKALGLGLINP